MVRTIARFNPGLLVEEFNGLPVRRMILAEVIKGG
jgi:hypothetical protein